MKFSKVKGWVATVATLCMLAEMKIMAMAATTAPTSVFNPAPGTDAGKIISAGMKWVVATVTAVAGGFFVFSLYMAITKFATQSHNAQKREEARTHVFWALGSGVLLGGALVFASAAYNFGHGL